MRTEPQNETVLGRVEQHKAGYVITAPSSASRNSSRNPAPSTETQRMRQPEMRRSRNKHLGRIGFHRCPAVDAIRKNWKDHCRLAFSKRAVRIWAASAPASPVRLLPTPTTASLLCPHGRPDRIACSPWSGVSPRI